jgi:hypothetical protein
MKLSLVLLGSQAFIVPSAIKTTIFGEESVLFSCIDGSLIGNAELASDITKLPLLF